MPEALRPDLQQILSQLISFVLLLLLLRRFAWGPLLNILDQRRKHIEDGLRHVAASKAEVERLKVEYSQRLAKIEDEARVKIQQAILEGKRISLEIQEQARAQAQEAMTKTKEAIELEVAKAKVQLRDHVAQLTVEAVEKVLRQKVDSKTDRQLVETVLDELQREPT